MLPSLAPPDVARIGAIGYPAPCMPSSPAVLYASVPRLINKMLMKHEILQPGRMYGHMLSPRRSIAYVFTTKYGWQSIVVPKTKKTYKYYEDVV